LIPRRTGLDDRIAQLEDDLKIASRRVAEMRTERDEANELVRQLREHCEEHDEAMAARKGLIWGK